MLKGDLSTTPLADVLLSLATDEATGCLHIVREDGEEALVYLKRGLVYAAYVPGRRPQLGARLISSGALMPEALEEALEAQATELQGWRLGELLVHLGYVDRGVVTAFVVEQLREGCYDLSRWPEGRWRFRKNEKTREDVGGACTVPDLLAEVASRGREWELINAAVHGPAAVPMLGAGGLAAAEMTLDQDQWALLCKVDGERTIAELARDCGFTDFEAGRIVYALVTQGLLEVEETVEEDDSDADEPPPSMSSIASTLASALAGPVELADDEPDEELLEPFEEDVTSFESFDDEPVITARIGQALVMPLSDEEWTPPEDEGSELSRLLGGAYAAPDPEPADLPLPAVPELTLPELSLPDLDLPPSLEPEMPADLLGEQDTFSESLARVSEALNALLDDAAPAEPHVIDAGSDGLGWRSDSRLDDELRREVEAAAIREAAAQAARLAETPAEPDADALRAAEELARRDDDAMRVRDAGAAALREMDETARREARGDAEPAPVWETQSLAELLGLNEPGSAGDSLGALIAAEQDAAARLVEDTGRRAAQADETALREAERAARREAEEAARREAELAAAAEAERVAAEAEAERVAAEAARVAAEQAAAAETERLAAERAEREAAAVREAEGAARREAERLAAEQAEREAAEAEETARREAERLAAEQAEREAAAEAEEAARREAERLAAEQAEREAAEAEEAARREAERLAAEQAEREAAAAAEAARLAAEQAAWEAEQAAAALAAERAEREAADAAEAARLAAEQAAAELAAQFAAEPAYDLTAAHESSAAEEAALLAAELAAAVPQQPAGSDDGLAFGDAAAMLRDIADASAATPEPDPEPEAAPDEPEPPTARQPLPPQRDADTASLLRELSSLGLDDEPAPVPAPSRPSGSPPRPAPKEAPKKRKGLFGRG